MIVMWRGIVGVPCPQSGGRDEKKISVPAKQEEGVRYQGLKVEPKSEAKIRASRRTRPIVRCVSVAKSSRRATAVRQQPKGERRRSS